MACDGEPRIPFDAPQRRLEPVVGEGLDAAALVADEMVVVVVGDIDPLVMRSAVAQVELLHEVLGREQIEDPVDARDADLAAVRS